MIPIPAPLAADLAGNDIIRVRGIVNGTTNFILTAMAQDGEPYDEVLREAQDQDTRRPIRRVTSRATMPSTSW